MVRGNVGGRQNTVRGHFWDASDYPSLRPFMFHRVGPSSPTPRSLRFRSLVNHPRRHVFRNTIISFAISTIASERLHHLLRLFTDETPLTMLPLDYGFFFVINNYYDRLTFYAENSTGYDISLCNIVHNNIYIYIYHL